MKIIIACKTVDLNSIVIEDMFPDDFPDFCDAYVDYAEFEDGTPLSEAQLEELTREYGNDLCHEHLN